MSGETRFGCCCRVYHHPSTNLQLEMPYCQPKSYLQLQAHQWTHTPSLKQRTQVARLSSGRSQNHLPVLHLVLDLHLIQPLTSQMILLLTPIQDHQPQSQGQPSGGTRKTERRETKQRHGKCSQLVDTDTLSRSFRLVSFHYHTILYIKLLLLW